MRRRPRDQRGLTLLETVVSIGIFSVITIGLFPLLASSLRGSTLARSYTVGKNVVVNGVERVRGLPYNKLIGTQPSNYLGQKTKLDVADLYFPCATSATCGPSGTTYDSSKGTFSTSCPPPSGTNPACPTSLPSGYTVSFVAEFVAATTSAGIESYSPLTAITSPPVPATYAWNLQNFDRAPSRLMRLSVTSAWTMRGSPRSFSVTTLVADRKFGNEKVNGRARVDYVVKIVTAYQDKSVPPRVSTVTATGATSETFVESRLATIADQTARAGQLSLTQDATLTEPAVTLASPPPTGASTGLEAPPDQSPSSPVATSAAQIMTHPDICQDPLQVVLTNCLRKQVAALGAGETNNFSASIGNDEPTATGTALFNPSGGAFGLFVDAQRNSVDSLQKNPLQLLGDSTYASGAAIKNPVLQIIPNTGVANNANCTPLSAPILCRSMFATTSATTTPISGASRRVQTTATTGFAEADLFPAKFIPGTGAGKPAIKILNFTAQVDCKSTGSALTATQLVQWSADLDYWVENDPNDGKTQGHYFSSQNIVNGAPTPLHLTESNAATTLAQLAAVNNNPMVFELPDDLSAIPPVVDRQQKDVYLFPQLDVQGQHPSLIVTIAASSGVLAPIGGADAGRTTSAQLPGALTFTTGVVDPDVAQSNLNVQFGGLTCNAADRR